MPSHLIDVISTDRHTVKPWFAGHADVSPAVADFAPQGYKLVGGRADYFNGQRAAATVYEHGAHVINVFTFRADGRALPALRSRDGYHIACWTAADLQYCAVSDAGWDELSSSSSGCCASSAAPTRGTNPLEVPAAPPPHALGASVYPLLLPRALALHDQTQTAKPERGRVSNGARRSRRAHGNTQWFMCGPVSPTAAQARP